MISSHPRLAQGQRGAVLVITLVMLAILTIIAVGTATDIGFQMNMSRNNQFSLQVFNTTMSELKAQYNASRDNTSVIENGQTIAYHQFLSNVYQSKTLETLDAANLLMANDNYQQEVSVEFMRAGICGGGDEIGQTSLIFEIHSTSSLASTGINSNQTFGICYPNPAAD